MAPEGASGVQEAAPRVARVPGARCRGNPGATINSDDPAPVKTRFAPSPSGFLHLGNARTALFNALWARRAGGVFLLRIEDSDPERSGEEYDQALREDLEWLGLGWQEGPGRSASRGPYRQSERGEVYRHYYHRLEELGHAYPCFCTPDVLEQARAAQLRAGRPPRYPGTCARLSADQVRERHASGLGASLRFRVPPDRNVEFEDLMRGPQRFVTSDLGDFIIRRADGTPAFFFCNALDDALMEVSDVLRGEDHLTNTPRQLLLLQALGLPAPRYGHLSLITGDDGTPLSKRHGARSVRELRESGYRPEALVNYLARVGHTYAEDRLVDLEELARGFDVARLGHAPARYDAAQLRHWQRLALDRLADADLWDWICARGPAEPASLRGLVPADKYVAFTATVRANIEFPEDALRWARCLFGEPPSYGEEACAELCVAGIPFFQAALAALAQGPISFEALRAALTRELGVKGRALFMPLRVALTTETHGPELARVWDLMGAERVRRRLAAALAQSGG
ncbi:MAG: glutamate--tRNA ligase [Chromatiales bacterium 21-64-14]|nr:MAG: glutamate--tRNA ligase [Chromatiales bacterium 21-64-14]